MTDLGALDATATADLIRNGELTPSEAVAAAIARIDNVNPDVNAVIHPLFDKAADADFAALLEAIEKTVSAVDERYPSVRFADAA